METGAIPGSGINNSRHGFSPMAAVSGVQNKNWLAISSA
jgi:hypothetical protein